MQMGKPNMHIETSTLAHAQHTKYIGIRRNTMLNIHACRLTYPHTVGTEILTSKRPLSLAWLLVPHPDVDLDHRPP